MQIVLLEDSGDGVIVREQVGDSLEGEFILAEDGSIQYRHEEAGALFCEPVERTVRQLRRSLGPLSSRRCDARRRDAQLEVVRILGQELREQGAFVKEGFWTSIYEQAEWGHL